MKKLLVGLVIMSSTVVLAEDFRKQKDKEIDTTQQLEHKIKIIQYERIELEAERKLLIDHYKELEKVLKRKKDELEQINEQLAKQV